MCQNEKCVSVVPKNVCVHDVMNDRFVVCGCKSFDYLQRVQLCSNYHENEKLK